jgi:hypothetical protein
MKIWFYAVVGSYTQIVAVIPSFLHNPPLVYNHTPLLYIVKISPTSGTISRLSIDFAEISKSQAVLKAKDIHRAYLLDSIPLPHVIPHLIINP